VQTIADGGLRDAHDEAWYWMRLKNRRTAAVRFPATAPAA
jgi:hypothetical protein